MNINNSLLLFKTHSGTDFGSEVRPAVRFSRLTSSGFHTRMKATNTAALF